MHEVSTAIAALLDATHDTESVGPTAVSDALHQLGLSDAESAGIAERMHRSQRELSRLRRREHELSALFSSARELAELRDSNAILSKLVQRAEEMIGVDIAYLSEFDPETRELRVRVTSGAVSEPFRHLRVAPRHGLASAIVESRSPQWIARYDDYADEHDLRYDRPLQDAVATEGLVSLLGVPMLTSDDVLGVLFVGTRDETHFTPEQISLLAALADHASVTLQTTQILGDMQKSAADARDALEKLTDHLGERERANTVHQELIQAVLAGGGFAPVAETLASALGRAVAIVDDQERMIAAAGMPLSTEMLAPEDRVRQVIAESRRSGHCIAVTAPGVRAVAAMTAGTQHFGAILLGVGDFELAAVDLTTIERAAQVASLIQLQQEAASGADHRVRSELIADLLDDVPERRSDVERRSRRLGVDLHALDSLLLFSVPGDQQSAAARALSRQLDERVLVGQYRGFVVVAHSSAHDAPDVERLRMQVAAAIGHPVAAVIPHHSPNALSEAFQTAMRTARLLTAMEVTDITAQVDEFLPYAAIFDTDSQALGAFLRDTIGAVRDYDAERGSDLLGTLRAFMRNNASPTRTARALNFHTNTILQRIDRLDHVLGADWRDDERMFRLSIAVRLDELRERLQSRRG